MIQGAIATAGITALLSFGACKSSPTSGTGTGTEATVPYTDPDTEAGVGGAPASDESCTDYGTNETETCDGACGAILEPVGNNLCADGVMGPLGALITCATSSCATSCPAFLACGPGYGIESPPDANCQTCLEKSCAETYMACIMN